MKFPFFGICSFTTKFENPFSEIWRKLADEKIHEKKLKKSGQKMGMD